MFSHEQPDSVYTSKRLVPRFGLNIQKGYGLEAGLFLNRFYTRFPKNQVMPMLPYASSGFFISSEVVIKDYHELIIGPKVGWELGVVGETHGSFFGAEFINYTDFESYSPALMLKIGLPMVWFNIGYGFTMYFEDTLKDKIGKHRITLSYTINRKTNRDFNRIQENYTSSRKE